MAKVTFRRIYNGRSLYEEGGLQHLRLDSAGGDPRVPDLYVVGTLSALVEAVEKNERVRSFFDGAFRTESRWIRNLRDQMGPCSLGFMARELAERDAARAEAARELAERDAAWAHSPACAPWLY